MSDSETIFPNLESRYASARSCAEAIVDAVGKEIRLALPLGIGKANLLTNALYDMAKEDPSISLKIYTALSIVRPTPSAGLERDFGGPLIDKLFGDYPGLTYAIDRGKGQLPPNVEVEEFFLATGTLLSNEYAQRHYNSVNYTHAMRRIISCNVNVLGQMIAEREGRYSLSCNSDLTLDMIPYMRQHVPRDQFIVVGEVNPNLPFMPNDAEVPAETFDVFLDCDGYDLPGPPASRVDTTSYAIGLRAATLVKDAGTLQIGIGSLGDGAAEAIRLRHENTEEFRKAITALPGEKGPVEIGGTDKFETGLYGCTEMFTQGMFELLLSGLFTREVYPDRPVTLDGGFFLGPQNFYKKLHASSDDILSRINMTSVGDINALYGREDEKRAQRQHARFINIAMKVTVLGAVISDALEDERVVSGVGGQYNFVSQAHELDGGRSVILLKSTRESGGKVESNIVWNYGHTTVPRHLRDIVITEYGIADLRGQTDEECVKRMLAISDSRFLDQLTEDAKASKKLRKDFQIPDDWRHNTPDMIETSLAPFQNVLPAFPFGTEMDVLEQNLALALPHLKDKMASGERISFALKAIFGANPDRYKDHMERIKLGKPNGLKDKIMAKLVAQALEDVL